MMSCGRGQQEAAAAMDTAGQLEALEAGGYVSRRVRLLLMDWWMQVVWQALELLLEAAKH